MDHLRRRERAEKQWTLSSLWSVLAPSNYRRRLVDSVKQISVRSWRAAPSVYEEYDDETRLLMIGAALNAHVERDGRLVIIEGREREQRVASWLEAHPHEAEWLASIEVTPHDAMQRHVEWLAGKEAWLRDAKSVGLTPGDM